jgi:hypothetical protein
MAIRTCIAAAGLLALAACGSSGTKGEGNGASTKAGSGGGGTVALQPGEWEMTMEMVNMSAPNLPPAIVAQMKRAPTVTRDCVTPEEAKGPKPETFAAQQNGNNCKQEDFVWGAGRAHGKTSCTSANGSDKMVMTMDGTYTPQSMDMTLKSETQTHNVSMSSEMHMTGRRIGECPAGKAG